VDSRTPAVGAVEGAVAIGRDNINSPITIGLTPEEVRDLTAAATKGAVGPLADKIVDLSQTLGRTQEAVLSMLRMLGQADISLDRLPEKLAEVAGQSKKAISAIGALQPENAVAREHIEKASVAASAGHSSAARLHLRGARQAAEAAAGQAQQLATQAETARTQQMLQAAQAAAAEAELVLADLDYLGAAQLFSEAASLVPAGHPDETVIFLHRQANALQRQGDERGDNFVLSQAIRVYGLELKEHTRKRVPLLWAVTQNNLGTALLTLGGRESGTTRLEEAVTAYRLALEERTRERVPLDWAMTQNNLGTALSTLGGRESGTARLEEAVTAYRLALEEWTRERLPLDWAVTQNNLGTALLTLGGRESGTARLEEAVAAYDGAQKIFLDSHSDYYEKMCSANRARALTLIDKRPRPSKQSSRYFSRL